MSRFLTAADAYVVLHHRLFEPLSEEFMWLPEDSIAGLNALADVPHEARPAPREGDIFSPAVADLFRRRIAATLQAYEYTPADVLAELDVEELVAPPIRVNKALPRGIGVMMPWLVGALPVLPEELAYRIVDHDFVLIDVQSNLVVDVIRAVLPTSAGAAQRPDDRAVPSENIESGRDTYAFHCAACHGRAGKGDGPVAPTLRAAPPDLTTIARRRDGRFPQAEVTAFIVGRRPAAHGSSDMPVWGPLFRELNPFDSRVDVRLLRLVDFLQSIQIK